MTEQKVFELASRLLARTKEGTQHWEGSVSDQAFLTSFPKYSVKVGRVADPDGENWLTVIWIYNEAGDEIEAAREDVLSEKLQDWGAFGTPRGPNVAGGLRELYEEARRSALNVEGALDDLLASLQ